MSHRIEFSPCEFPNVRIELPLMVPVAGLAEPVADQRYDRGARPLDRQSVRL
jgi:hypothetical protein